MSSLSGLPSEVLGAIVGLPKCGFIFLRLWLSGNAALHTKLSQGVTRIGLSSTAPLGVSKFPRALLSLPHLRRLKLKSLYRLLEHPSSWYGIVESLPPTLQRLRFCFPESNLPFFTSYGPHSALPGSLAGEKQQSQAIRRILDLQSLFPDMHTLRIDDVIGRQHDNGFALQILPSLPPTLTRLGLGLIQTSALPFMAALPRHLTRLDSPVFTSNTDIASLRQDWAQSPPDLTAIDFIYAPHDDLGWLPRSLTDAQLKLHNDLNSSVASLPPTFRRLRYLIDGYPLTRVVSSFIAQLPKFLVSLEFMSPSESLYFSIDHLRALPSSLRSLRSRANLKWNSLTKIMLDENGNRKDDFEKVWPPNLTDLMLCPRDVTSLNNCLKCLPTSLNKLSLVLAGDLFTEEGLLNDKDGARIDASLFSTSLTHLKLSSKNLVCVIGSFSSSLEILDLSSLEGLTRAIERSVFPASLRTLQLDNRRFSADYALLAHLPLRLTKFDIHEWQYDWLDSIPQSATWLIIRHLICTVNETANYFGSLPIGLTTLEVERCSNGWPQRIIDSLDFSHLVHLETLNFPLAVNAHRFFSKLPRSLRSLTLRCEASASDASNLPSLLRSVSGVVWSSPLKELAETFPPLAIASFPKLDPKYQNVLVERCRHHSTI